jgi:hypothetical protein
LEGLIRGIHDVMSVFEYEPEKLKDDLGKDFQGCLLPEISIESRLNRYSGSLHKLLKSNKFEYLSRAGHHWLFVAD